MGRKEIESRERRRGGKRSGRDRKGREGDGRWDRDQESETGKQRKKTAGETAQFIRHLWHTCEDLSSDPQHPCKSNTVTVDLTSTNSNSAE